jgi:hypothetical protein
MGRQESVRVVKEMVLTDAELLAMATREGELSKRWEDNTEPK